MNSQKKERINSKAKKEMISMLIYDSADFMNEMKFLGIEMSKVFVRSPQCNGIIERFHRTLEEQVLQVEAFTSFEKAHYSINQFINNYNKEWILHRLDIMAQWHEEMK